ncbi:uncharacterized protein M421DRAFT_249206 [Didymella exigua CBS 183.55]|uniref:Uncharacterized protein n=1 Tax=Didymella exigua CBS 183.55 TaxID=1150837 RepID=A0A6A5RY73_9PLEO|nr:uncharacterized protein M421DRAFT_249206 [Didymella exigua CBS 183.55]KAF1932782.1 hypothetical protein M421DRAFT_249206 [Didymella exigua CBS 183.55]
MSIEGGIEVSKQEMNVEESLKEQPPQLFVVLGREAQLSFQVSGAALACCRQLCRCFTFAQARLQWFGSVNANNVSTVLVQPPSWRMRANRPGRNESLSRVSDEIAVFQVSPHGYIRGSWLMDPVCARLSASAVSMYECVVYKEKSEVKSKTCCAVKSQECFAVSCHICHRAGFAQEPPSHPSLIRRARSCNNNKTMMEYRKEMRFEGW